MLIYIIYIFFFQWGCPFYHVNNQLVSRIAVDRTERRPHFRRRQKRFAFVTGRLAAYRRRRDLRPERRRRRRRRCRCLAVVLAAVVSVVLAAVLRVEHLTAAAIDIGVPLTHRVHLTEERSARTGERVADAIGRHAVVGADVEEPAARFHIGIVT